MEEAQSSTKPTSSYNDLSVSNSRLEKLIDIPFSEKLSDNLVALFNYFDIYAPKMELLYEVITYFRLFQLIGASMMANNADTFKPGTPAYKVVSIMTILFHLIPLEYRRGNGSYILYAFNGILIVFTLYLVITSFLYVRTSRVSKFSVIVLVVSNAILTFLVVPLLAQYTGQIVSAQVTGVAPVIIEDLVAEILSVIMIYIYIWILINAYSLSLVFRQCSFACVQKLPQIKLYITTIIVTFISSLTIYLTSIPSACMIAICIAFYVYSASTVFNSINFIKERHQVMVLGGSVLGIITCIANLIIFFLKRPWGSEFFAGFFIVGFFTLFFTRMFIKRKVQNELKLLDEIQETRDIHVLKNFKKFYQVLITGFTYSHPICIDYSLFKLACEEWPNILGIWACYAKFVAIYPENTNQLSFITQHIAGLKIKGGGVNKIIESIDYLIKTREIRFTPQLKSKIAKLSKMFNTTKNRLRNIWDLILQGNVNEMNTAIKRTQESVNQCIREVDYLVMSYPNNRYVSRQSVKLNIEIVCNPILTKKSIDDLAKLNRGILVREDTILELGKMAFPNIPSTCITIQETGTKDKLIESESIEDFVVDEMNNPDGSETILRQIENHKVPAVSFICYTTIICYIGLVLVPLIALIVLYSYYKISQEKPITIMQGMANIRSIVTMLIAFTGRYLLQNLDDPKNPGHKLMGNIELAKDFKMDAFGNFRYTDDILKYVASTVPSAAIEMSYLTQFEPHDELMNQARKLLFAQTIKYQYYLNNTYSIDTPTTMTELCFILMNKVGKLLDNSIVTPEVAASSDSITIRHANAVATNTLNSGLDIMIQFLKNQNAHYTKLLEIGLIALVFLCVVVYPIVLYFQVKKLRQNKYEILNTFTLLPKTVISQISVSFTKLKDSNEKTSTSENADAESHRQEDSIIKLFASVCDGNSNSSIEIFIMILTIFIIGFTCLSYFISIHTFSTASINLVFNCHHINYLFGCVAYTFAALARLLKVTLYNADPIFENTAVGVANEVVQIGKVIKFIVDYGLFIRLGGTGKNEIPFAEMRELIDEASVALVCNNASTPPENVIQSVHCLTADQQSYVFIALMKKYYNLMLQGSLPDPRDKTVQRLWQIGPIEMYETFYYPAQQMLIPIIMNDLDKEGISQIVYSVILMAFTLVLSIAIITIAKAEESFLKFAMKLLLKCPATVLMNNQKLMDLLAGHYNYSGDSQKEKFGGYSNEIVNKLNDTIIVCQEETGKIITVNQAFEEMFNIKLDEIKDKHIKEFFTEERFSSTDKIQKVFTQTANLVYVNSSGTKVYLEFTTACVSGKRIYSGRDNTQNVMHEKLMVDEKKKSDSMLASILPPMLVPRVQAGEKNISFSVQSASILFLDVVEFTPWCGSHDAQYVMRMLNIMFKEFDAITNAHKTMTKIKCIGDCYMAAGGIFDEVNQPAVHAKEVVDFGCLVIKKLLEIDESEKESLRIRVGVNTGGPIVAGVIGTEKPTFEILGPAINIAHEMEHHGVPMKVHISRPVYELIYGQSFDIKERGEIDVKNGKMFTYLVEP